MMHMEIDEYNDQEVGLFPSYDNQCRDRTHRYIVILKNVIKSNVTEGISRMIVHVGIHMTFLSILEPIFYFLYVIQMEEQIFYDQIESLSKAGQYPIPYDALTDFRMSPIYDPFIDYIQSQNANVDGYYMSLEQSASDSQSVLTTQKHALEKKAFLMCLYISTSTFVYYSIHQYTYREKYLLPKLLTEHITLILFIALYEFWFLNNVILAYSPFTVAEIRLKIFSCLWVNLISVLPELSFIDQGHQITC